MCSCIKLILILNIQTAIYHIILLKSSTTTWLLHKNVRPYSQSPGIRKSFFSKLNSTFNF